MKAVRFPRAAMAAKEKLRTSEQLHWMQRRFPDKHEALLHGMHLARDAAALRTELQGKTCFEVSC